MSTLIYIADPMSSWSYAFHSELDRIREETGLPVRLVVGGLFVGDRAIPFNENFQSYLRKTWARVAHRSGRPFSPALTFGSEWVYNTELACRAVVAARQLDEPTTLTFLHRLQTAFYQEGADLTDREAYRALAEDVGLDGDEITARLDRLDVISATRADFSEAKELGAAGMPTLLLENGSELIKVSAGFNQANHVLRSISVLSS